MYTLGRYDLMYSLGRNTIEMFNEGAFNGHDNLTELNLLNTFNRCNFDVNVFTKMPSLKLLIINPDSQYFLQILKKLHHLNNIQVKMRVKC